MKAILFGMMTLLLATPAAAQVGHEPTTSPYSDLQFRHEITPLGGYVSARKDEAGVLPQSGALAGLKYEIYLGGPVSFSSEVSRMSSERDVIDPFKPAATRRVRTEATAVYAADVSIALSLTGRKSWNRIVPQIRAGAGVVGSRAKDDSSGYAFGTPFAFHFGGGLKFVPGGRLQFRLDATERLFKRTYPDSFYRLASDNTAVLKDATPRSGYTHHTILTVGLSYLFGR